MEASHTINQKIWKYLQNIKSFISLHHNFFSTNNLRTMKIVPEFSFHSTPQINYQYMYFA